jgi:putative Mn2+ efflux pump MntP
MNIMRIILAIATLITALALAFGSAWFLAKDAPKLLIAATLMLTAVFGYFVGQDYIYFFGKKTK